MTYSSINDDILAAEEKGSLARVSTMGYLVKEQGIIRPVKVLPRSVSGSKTRGELADSLDIICYADFAGDEVV